MVRPSGICIHVHGSLLFLGEAIPVSIDFSKATKLRDVAFRPGSSNVEWVTATLQTISPAHQNLRQISIYVPKVENAVLEGEYRELYAQMMGCIKSSLPETIGKGMVDLVEY